MAEQREEFEDSFIGDVRRTRAKILRECGNDFSVLARKLQEVQAQHPGPVVNLREQKERSKKAGA
jgi:hypothetical protein